MDFLFAFALFLLALPLIFVIWVLYKIIDLSSSVKNLKFDRDILLDRFMRAETKIRKLEKQLEEGHAPQPVAPQPKPEASASTAATIEQASSLTETTPVYTPEQKTTVAQNLTEQTQKAQTPTPASDNEILPPLPPRVPTALKAQPDLAGKVAQSLSLSGSSGSWHKEPSSWQSEDMESLIGGSLMNKVGAFLLVIGIALFLIYSFEALGPLAKLGAATLFSAGLLGWGAFLDRKNENDIMAMGIIGAGWSGLYLTAFSAHGVAATKVISSPEAGMALLVMVSAGMIVHSLKYKSEMATGLGFIFAFVGLFITEVSMFTESAALVLSAGMMGLSWYFGWYQIATSGIILTYGSLLARMLVRAPQSGILPIQQLFFLQPVLIATWLIFEVTSMNFIRSKAESDQVDRFIFPMNLMAYLITARVIWPVTDSTPLSLLTGLVAVQYLISALARAFWAGNPGESSIEKGRVFLGSSEDCIVVVAGAACMWMWYVLPAPVVVIGWIILSLLLIEVAWRLPWQLLRLTGHFIASLSFFRVFIANFTVESSTSGISHRILTVVPILFAMYYLYSRTITEPDWEASPTGGTKAFAPAYSYFGFLLIAFLIRFEFDAPLTSPLWAICAVVLAALSVWLDNRHFGRQSVLAGIGAMGYALSSEWKYAGAIELIANIWTLGLFTVASLYLAYFLFKNDPKAPLEKFYTMLDYYGKEILATCGNICLALLFFIKISGGYLTLVWSLLGMGLLMTGFSIKDRIFRLSGLGLVGLCILKIFLYDVRVLDPALRILAFICLGATMIAISWAYTRFKDRFEELIK